MESARNKCMLTVSAKQFWELNICVICTKPLDSTSKLLNCLHGVCNRCIDLGLDKPGHFVCDCGVVTDISNRLINCTLFCEQFDESILRNNHMDKKYQKEKYGQYITKVPCPNCDDKYIEAYCTTCNKLHCALCQLVGHRSHHCKTIGRVMAEIRLNIMKKNFDLWYGENVNNFNLFNF
ncbi:uncharacterized protein LOC100574333 isoform X1 [Acyrthosiphon pisum]|uniref:B box-type domain-containing protein n=1 Tax=Acyrthosiphon pisum TaxID=7029 RepID=A0A8R2NK90_ACYPI|nr:uncharacterized protein LOC100574333 isoform X1 [Acyrthosiphon pisum]